MDNFEPDIIKGTAVFSKIIKGREEIFLYISGCSLTDSGDNCIKIPPVN